jgi:hypothetical protein
MTRRVLLLATTTGYQTRAFGDAAHRIDAELAFATDRCHLLEDPWRDAAIPIRFYDEDASVAAILQAAAARPLDGLVVVGDRPTVIGGRVAQGLGLPWHPAAGAEAARHKQLTRERLRDAGLPVPWFVSVALGSPLSAFGEAPTTGLQSVSYPCVVKPVALSGSRGVMRADDSDGLAAAFERLRALMQQPDVRAERNDAHAIALIEGFIPGREYALEGVMHHGALQLLAIFDKPDPLDGPFFEETIYLTPSTAPDDTQRAMVDGVTRAVRALGLRHGPIHAECRVDGDRVYVLEVAARPIGGLCARALRFRPSATRDQRSTMSLEELLLRQALGEDPAPYRREDSATGVMMIPIPKRGILRGIDGADEARAVDGVDEIHITAKPDQLLVPLPEGASYLGFIFARAGTPALAERALRLAHARLVFAIDQELPVLAPGQIHYNLLHG